MRAKSLHPCATHRNKRGRFSRVVFCLCLLSSCGCLIAILAGFLFATIPVLMIGFALEEVAAISFVVVYLLAPRQTYQIGHLTKQRRADLRAALGESDWMAVEHSPFWNSQCERRLIRLAK